MVGFARTLRSAGVEASTDRVQAMLTALSKLDVTFGRDAYWAGRLTMCASPLDVERYDAAFAAYFGNEMPRVAQIGLIPQKPQLISVQTAADQHVGDDEELQSNPNMSRASDLELLRRKDVAAMSAVERDEV